MIKNIVFHGDKIVEGWKNYYSRTLSIEEVADIRRKICNENKCGKYSHGKICIYCEDCGCPIEKKIRSLKSACDLGYWGMISDIDLIVSPLLFEKSGFYVERVSESIRYYRHKKHPHITIWFNTTNNIASNGIETFHYWKDIEEYFKLKTNKTLY